MPLRSTLGVEVYRREKTAARDAPYKAYMRLALCESARRSWDYSLFTCARSWTVRERFRYRIGIRFDTCCLFIDRIVSC